MKKYLLALLLSLSTLTAQASSLKLYPHDTAFLGNLDVIMLNNVENSHLIVYTPYPGQISNNCTLIMRTESGDTLKPLLDRLIITSMTPPAPEVRGSLIYALGLETYLSGITIQTKDGKSIGENTRAVFPPQRNEGDVNLSDVGLQAGVCHRKF